MKKPVEINLKNTGDSSLKKCTFFQNSIINTKSKNMDSIIRPENNSFYGSFRNMEINKNSKGYKSHSQFRITNKNFNNLKTDKNSSESKADMIRTYPYNIINDKNSISLNEINSNFEKIEKKEFNSKKSFHMDIMKNIFSHESGDIIDFLKQNNQNLKDDVNKENNILEGNEYAKRIKNYDAFYIDKNEEIYDTNVLIDSLRKNKKLGKKNHKNQETSTKYDFNIIDENDPKIYSGNESMKKSINRNYTKEKGISDENTQNMENKTCSNMNDQINPQFKNFFIINKNSKKKSFHNQTIDFSIEQAYSLEFFNNIFNDKRNIKNEDNSNMKKFHFSTYNYNEMKNKNPFTKRLSNLNFTNNNNQTGFTNFFIKNSTFTNKNNTSVMNGYATYSKFSNIEFFKNKRNYSNDINNLRSTEDLPTTNHQMLLEHFNPTNIEKKNKLRFESENKGQFFNKTHQMNKKLINSSLTSFNSPSFFNNTARNDLTEKILNQKNRAFYCPNCEHCNVISDENLEKHFNMKEAKNIIQKSLNFIINTYDNNEPYLDFIIKNNSDTREENKNNNEKEIKNEPQSQQKEKSKNKEIIHSNLGTNCKRSHNPLNQNNVNNNLNINNNEYENIKSNTRSNKFDIEALLNSYPKNSTNREISKTVLHYLDALLDNKISLDSITGRDTFEKYKEKLIMQGITFEIKEDVVEFDDELVIMFDDETREKLKKLFKCNIFAH